MEFPSQSLNQQLATLGLAVPADLRRCAGIARRLAGGLPATDSVWIDALVHMRLLTPWQARQLESDHGSKLTLGGKYVLQTHRLLDPQLNVYEARISGQKHAVLLSCLRTNPNETEEALARLTQTIRSLSPCRDKIPGLPIDALIEQGQLCLVSPFTPGESLASLLVRRGRFSEEVVRSLALELVRQFQATEPFALHGDLRLSNLWLNKNGSLALLNWGLLAAASPVVTIHTPLPLDAGDSIAPERIDAQRRSVVNTEIYSLGCILWQLLAGRPPFVLTDPLAKLTAHRTRNIPDVRTVSPETSESLATLIRNMTAREANRRIQTFAEVRQQLSGPGRPRVLLQEFTRTFDSIAPVQRTASRRKTSSIPATVAMLLIGLTLGGLAWNRDLLGLPRLSRLGAAEATRGQEQFKPLSGISSDQQGNLPKTVENATASPATDVKTVVERMQHLALPKVQDHRVILTAGTHYSAGTLEHADALALVTDPQNPATVHVRDVPLILNSRQVSLQNVQIVIDTDSSVQRPVQIQAATLDVQHVWCGSSSFAGKSPLLTWTTPALNGAGRLVIRDSEFVASTDLMEVHGPLSTALLENVSTEGTQAVLQLHQGAASGMRVPVLFNACTLRNTGALVSLPTGAALQRSGRIAIQGADSLVDLALGSGLIELQGTEPEGDWATHVEIVAQGIVAPRELILALLRNPVTQSLDELDASGMTVDGLLSGAYRFQAAAGGKQARDRLLIDSLPVRFSDRLPGADPDRLPRRPDRF